LRQLKGLGPKTVERLRAGLKLQQETGKRLTLLEAEPYVRDLLRHMRAVRGIGKVEVAGSYRRGRETIGDIDLVATAENAPKAITAFAAYPEVAQVIAQGSTRDGDAARRRSGRSAGGRTGGLWRSAVLLHRKSAHNTPLPAGAARPENQRIRRLQRRFASPARQKSVFAAVGLPDISPELRKIARDRCSRERVAAGTCPPKDLHGDLHARAMASDGQDI
jgi:DNA polymerase (family 10)